MGLSISRNQLEEDKEDNINSFYDFWNFYLDYDINF